MTAAIDELLAVMRALRDKETGCPWDLKQDFHSLAPYAIEEAYEVADAVDRRDFNDLKLELGDLLLQVVFHAQLAQEADFFDFEDVAASITSKLICRHPHVFNRPENNPVESVPVLDAETQTRLWEGFKKAEREQKYGPDSSALAGITRGLPEWQRANKLQKKAASVGFDWPDIESVFSKLQEEILEVREELEQGRGHSALEDEIGDILFVCVNLCRHAKVDFGSSLRRSNAKFERRFRQMEQLAGNEGLQLAQMGLAEQESLWNRVKIQEAPNDTL
jgi:ATP diphosphatase